VWWNYEWNEYFFAFDMSVVSDVETKAIIYLRKYCMVLLFVGEMKGIVCTVHGVMPNVVAKFCILLQSLKYFGKNVEFGNDYS
jgi:hypothetical protein